MTMNTELTQQMALLAKGIAKLTQHTPFVETAIPGLTVFRISETSEPLSGLYEPSVCLIAQGEKKVQLNDETFFYDTEHYLFSGLHLPVFAQVVSATKAKPYIGLKLTFDYQEITQLMLVNQIPAPQTKQSNRGMLTGKLTSQMISAFQRMIDLNSEEEAHIPTLAPMIRREIFYRLLVAEQGETLRNLASLGTPSNQMTKAIIWLKANLFENIRVETLADLANMSVSTFHHHFRNITAMTPLQYMKALRLQEARRLMLTEHLDSATAAFNVGYESPSQFGREYKRMFGNSPIKDVEQLRERFIAT
ncbi:AraC family transcriptional regulator [Alteromonas sp. NFXS44]|uniref:AraC family transcriptional regulator n=1 Tax=Alteromonas sp. NFXS44 TaxID=2818435 RepID=UPI0032DEAD33